MTTKSITNKHMGHGRKRSKGHTIIGVALAVTGFFWLAKKVGWIPVAAGGSPIFWPAITIAVGIAIIISVKGRHAPWTNGETKTADQNIINQREYNYEKD